MDYEDLPLEPARPSFGQSLGPDREPRPGILRWVLVVVAAMATGGLLTFWWMSRTQPEPASPAPAAATDVPIGPNRPAAQDLTLPALDESDAFLRDLVAVLVKECQVPRETIGRIEIRDSFSLVEIAKSAGPEQVAERLTGKMVRRRRLVARPDRPSAPLVQGVSKRLPRPKHRGGA